MYIETLNTIAWKRYEATVYYRCGMEDEGRRLEVEAEAMLEALNNEFSAQAGIVEG